MRSTLKLLIFLLLILTWNFPLLAQQESEQKDPATVDTPQEESATSSTDEEDSGHEAETTIETTAGVWGNHFVEDSSKAEEYGEVPEGFLINSFKVNVALRNDRFVSLSGTNVGLNNGQYSFGYGVIGKYDFFLDYNKIPHLFSRDGETIWTETSPGIWSLPDNLQLAIENLNPVDPSDPAYSGGLATQRNFISGLLTTAHPFDLRLQRNRTSTGFSYSPNTRWRYGVNYFLENRDGYRPFGTAFGFSWATELPEHIKYDTQNFRLSAEYSSRGKTFAVSYDLNLFDNDINRMIWDNPLRLNDRTYDSGYVNGDATSRGQMQLAPDITSNMISAAGSTQLGGGRLTGSFAYVFWDTEVDLLPFTINTSIPEIPLPAQTFNGEQNNLNFTLRYTKRIGEHGDFTANYRLFDHNNNNDRFNIGEYVRLDAVEEPLHRFDCNAQGICVEVENPPTHLYAYSANTVDFDLGWRVADRTRVFATYQYDRWNREERDVEETSTNRFRTGIDYRGTDWMSLHLSYQYSRRRSDDFAVDSPVAPLPNGQLFEFLPLRRYDVANLNQNLIRAMADFVAGDKTTIGFTFGLSDNNFVDTIYGVQRWDDFSVGIDLSYAVTESTTVNAWYEYSKIERDQRGRQTGASACDPATTECSNFDWTIDLSDQYNTVGAGFTTGFHGGKTTWNTNLTYAMADGEADFGAINEPAFIAANRRGALVDLADVDDTDLFSFRSGLNFRAFRNAKIGLFYWYEKYLIDDFAEDSLRTDLIFIPNPVPGSPAFTGGTITLNARQPDYEFHSGWLGFIFNW